MVAFNKGETGRENTKRKTCFINVTRLSWQQIVERSDVALGIKV